MSSSTKNIKKFMFDNFIIKDNEIIEKEQEEPVEPQEQELPSAPAEPQENVNETADTEEIIDIGSEDAENYDVKEEIPVTYSQEDLDNAVRIAEERAYERGFKSAMESLDAGVSGTLQEMNSKLGGIMAESCSINEDVEKQFLEMSKGIINRLLPDLAEEHAVEIVNKFIGDNFKNFKKEAKLSFYVNPDVISSVQENIAHLANINDFEGKISLHKDANLGRSDCRVEWENGGVEHNTNGFLNKMNSLLTRTTGESEK